MQCRKNIFIFFVFVLLQSCVVHSHFPFICFLKKCRQPTRSQQRYEATKRIDQRQTNKLKNIKSKGGRHKVKNQTKIKRSIATPSF
jgi:hypothetical protein